MIRHSLALLFVAELFASAIGFVVMILLARRLGPHGFANFEYGAAVAAWWLVVVRGGFDTIVYREAARRPRLIRPLTDALIGLRLASAGVGLAAVLALAWASGPGRGTIVAIAGLVLIPSALASDVGLRASGRFGPLALTQVIRAVGFALGVGSWVRGSGDARIAVGCLVIAELGSTSALLWIHGSEHGWIRPRFRRPVWTCLARRGAVVGLCRFARVGLYAADLLIIGNLAASTTLGPYAAGRRLAFALLALGLVVPSALGPRFANAWASGADQARSMIALTYERLLIVVLPATLGLILTSDRWMACLFGEPFREGGPWLALIVARIPFVLISNLQQTTLTACRREAWALRLILAMVALGMVTLVPLALISGPSGVAWGVLGIEAFGALAGWVALGRLGLAPRWHHSCGPAFVGCASLLVMVSVGQDWSLALVVVCGATSYAIAFSLVKFGRSAIVPFGLRKGLPILSGGSST